MPERSIGKGEGGINKRLEINNEAEYERGQSTLSAKMQAMNRHRLKRRGRGKRARAHERIRRQVRHRLAWGG